MGQSILQTVIRGRYVVVSKEHPPNPSSRSLRISPYAPPGFLTNETEKDAPTPRLKGIILRKHNHESSSRNHRVIIIIIINQSPSTIHHMNASHNLPPPPLCRTPIISPAPPSQYPLAVTAPTANISNLPA